MAPRILLADDEPRVLQGLRTILQSRSRFEVCGTAMNGAEVLVKAQELRPDLIILDLAMPVMNGLDAALGIAKILPEVPVVMYTLTVTPQVRQKAAEVGIRQVVDKSAGARALLSAVEAALGKGIAAIPQAGGNALPLAIAAETSSSTPPLPDSCATDPSNTS